MRVPTFIGVASLLICSWLGVAFVREVPVGNYPATEGSLVAKPAPTTHKSLAVASDEPPRER